MLVAVDAQGVARLGKAFQVAVELGADFHFQLGLQLVVAASHRKREHLLEAQAEDVVFVDEQGHRAGAEHRRPFDDVDVQGHMQIVPMLVEQVGAIGESGAVGEHRHAVERALAAAGGRIGQDALRLFHRDAEIVGMHEYRRLPLRFGHADGLGGRSAALLAVRERANGEGRLGVGGAGRRSGRGAGFSLVRRAYRVG